MRYNIPVGASMCPEAAGCSPEMQSHCADIVGIMQDSAAHGNGLNEHQQRHMQDSIDTLTMHTQSLINDRDIDPELANLYEGLNQSGIDRIREIGASSQDREYKVVCEGPKKRKLLPGSKCTAQVVEVSISRR